jgi:predicted  nucleic acid-binding Zn-ribbon protein
LKKLENQSSNQEFEIQALNAKMKLIEKQGKAVFKELDYSISQVHN